MGFAQIIPGENHQTARRNLVTIHTHHVFLFQRQYHSQIDDLIEETVKEMITLLVAKVAFRKTIFLI